MAAVSDQAAQHIHIAQGLSQGLRDGTLVPKELAKQLFRQVRYWLTIIHIARCEAESQDFALIIDHQVQFEAIKPAG